MRELTNDEVAELREMGDRLAEIMTDAGYLHIEVGHHAPIPAVPAGWTSISVATTEHPANACSESSKDYSVFAGWESCGVKYLHAERSR